MAKRVRQTFESLTIPILATLLGLLVSSVFVLASRTDPIQAYQRLFCEGFGPKGCANFGHLLFINVASEEGAPAQTVFAPLYGSGGHKLAVVLERGTVLILTALSATVAFQAGMFSIGMDGQLVLGAITAAFLGYWIPDQIYALAGVDAKTASEGLLGGMRLLVPLLCIGAAMAVGAFYSWIAGYLKVKLNVNELISTIILNAIAVQLVGYLVNFPLRSDFNNIARTRRIDDTAWLVPFNRGIFPEVEWFSGARVGIGIILALLAALLVWFFLWRMTAGYEQRMTRGSALFARFGGIPSEWAAIRAMLISGALSGLAGAIQILGVERRVVDGFAGSGLGFDGVLVAILAKESIPGIILVSLFFAGLEQGAVNLQFGNLPRQLGGIIIAFIILFSSMEEFFKSNFARIRARFGPRQRPAAAEASGGSA
jgi:simple sugar transport system permease protein